MKFRYALPDKFIADVSNMEEFANGATQVTVKLGDGSIFKEILISGSKYIVAIRGFSDLPFSPNDIKEIFQGEEDKNPSKRTGWLYWDNWS